MNFEHVLVYLRYSTDIQGDGNSFDRQRELANSYLARHQISYSSLEWVEDPGISAFNGEHVRTGALGRLLKRLREKTVSNGLVIFEAVDRASREGSLKFFSILSDFLEAGFAVAFLDEPDKAPFTKKKAPRMLLTVLSLKAELANLESERKSELSGDNWERRRKLARQEGMPISAECPRWLKVEGGKYVILPEMVESIDKVFQLARDGWGVSKIVRHANINGWPVPGNGKTWHLSLINRLFSNRAVIGEYQPFEGAKAERRPIGQPIVGYYPCIVEPSLFYEVRGRRDEVVQFPNRRDDNNYNYLMGLGRCECGGTWRRLNKNSGKQIGYAQYSCSNRQRGVTMCTNISSRVFDYNFIAGACEKIPELMQVVDDKRISRKIAITNELYDIEKRLKKVFELYEISAEDDVVEVRERLRDLQQNRKELRSVLAELEQTAPPSGPFDFGQAVTAYLPAFLDVHVGSETIEARKAFDTRSLFRTRILQSVKCIVVANSRGKMTVTLKNGIEFEQEIRPVEFSLESELDEIELQEMMRDQVAATQQLLGAEV